MRKLPPAPEPEFRGLIVEKAKNYYIVAFGKATYVAHFTSNSRYYDVGHKITFRFGSYNGEKVVLIQKLVSSTSYVTAILKALFDARIEKKFVSFPLSAIIQYKTLAEFCAAKKVVYRGIVDNKFLFECVAQ